MVAGKDPDVLLDSVMVEDIACGGNVETGVDD
jgi:hypothetical protein